MRILFVSGAPFGGSLLSTQELGARLVARGHAVGVLHRVVRAERRRRIHEHAIDLAARLGDGPAAALVAAAAARVGRRPTRLDHVAGMAMWESVFPENALGAVRRDFRPDVVVAASISYPGWQKIRRDLAADGIAGVLYLREETGLGHLDRDQVPDLLLANAAALTEAAARRGHCAVTVPSVVTLDRYRVQSSRERVLFANLVPIQGLETAVALAAAHPELQFAFREWWVLDDADRAALAARVTPNVELLPPTGDPHELYGDARVLLAPMRFNGRPRLVLEAQVNGIPVLGSSNPAVAEAVGEGGVVVPADAPIEQWSAALSELLDDPERYDAYCAAARLHAARDEVDPEHIVDCFESAIADLVASRPSAVEPTGTRW